MAITSSCSFPKLHCCGCCLLSFWFVLHPHFPTIATTIYIIRLFFTRLLLTRVKIFSHLTTGGFGAGDRGRVILTPISSGMLESFAAPYIYLTFIPAI